MSTGRRIKELRKKAGLTQKELGEKLGVAYQTLAQWENDLRNPKIETLHRISAALNVPITELVGTADDLDNQITRHLQEAKQSLEEREEGLSDFEKRKKWMNGVLSFENAAHKASYLDAVKAEELGKELLSALQPLNDAGRQEALKRIQELSYVPDYQKEKSPPEAKEKASEGE